MAMGPQLDRRGELMARSPCHVFYDRLHRIHLVDYFEGINSEHGLEWRCSASLSLREFLWPESRDRVPDRSWLSKTHTRLPREAFKLSAEIVERPFAHNLDRGGMRELGGAGARTCTSDTYFMSPATISHC